MSGIGQTRGPVKDAPINALFPRRNRIESESMIDVTWQPRCVCLSVCVPDGGRNATSDKSTSCSYVEYHDSCNLQRASEDMAQSSIRCRGRGRALAPCRLDFGSWAAACASLARVSTFLGLTRILCFAKLPLMFTLSPSHYRLLTIYDCGGLLSKRSLGSSTRTAHSSVPLVSAAPRLITSQHPPRDSNPSKSDAA